MKNQIEQKKEYVAPEMSVLEFKNQMVLLDASDEDEGEDPQSFHNLFN